MLVRGPKDLVDDVAPGNMFIPVLLHQVDQTVTDAGDDEDICSCICQQLTRLLQQCVSWC